jgi:hypothetical protein
MVLIVAYAGEGVVLVAKDTVAYLQISVWYDFYWPLGSHLETDLRCDSWSLVDRIYTPVLGTADTKVIITCATKGSSREAISEGIAP